MAKKNSKKEKTPKSAAVPAPAPVLENEEQLMEAVEKVLVEQNEIANKVGKTICNQISSWLPYYVFGHNKLVFLNEGEFTHAGAQFAGHLGGICAHIPTNKTKANRLDILLMPDDTYTVCFASVWNDSQKGLQINIKSCQVGIYIGDVLVDYIEEMTGLPSMATTRS